MHPISDNTKSPCLHYTRLIWLIKNCSLTYLIQNVEQVLAVAIQMEVFLKVFLLELK